MVSPESGHFTQATKETLAPEPPPPPRGPLTQEEWREVSARMRAAELYWNHHMHQEAFALLESIAEEFSGTEAEKEARKRIADLQQRTKD